MTQNVRSPINTSWCVFKGQRKLRFLRALWLQEKNKTRLNETIADNEISISGYNIVRRDRPLNGRNGGGVCFYVRSVMFFI